MCTYRCVDLTLHWKGLRQTSNTPAFFPGHILHFLSHHTHQCALCTAVSVTARIFTPLSFSRVVFPPFKGLCVA